jgi:hypothetical protein
MPIADFDCCTPETRNLGACFPVDLSLDVFFTNASGGSHRCMSLTRSSFGCNEERYGEQMNGVTSFLDASTIYGSTDDVAWSLRGKKQRPSRDGMMAQNTRWKDFILPTVEDLGTQQGRLLSRILIITYLYIC